MPTPAPSEHGLARPVLAALVLVWAAWMALLLATVGDPPVDNVEQLTWVRSLEWGYHKHPPLATWLIWPAAQVFGLHAAVAALLGGLVQLAALVLWWDLLRRLCGPRTAWIGLACALAIVHHSARLHHYNHNTVMLPLTVTAAWCLWRAWTDGRWRWWLGLGLALGLGLLAKYQMVTTVCATLLFVAMSWTDESRARRRRIALGLALAVLVAAAVVAPHALWLLSHPANPLVYAGESSLGVGLGAVERLRQWVGWMADLLVRSGGALLLLGGLALWARRAAAGATPGAPDAPPACTAYEAAHAAAHEAAHAAHAATHAARRLLLCWAVVPLLAVAAMGLLAGAATRPHWATVIALWLLPPVLMAIGEARLQAISARRVLIAAAAVQLLLMSHHTVQALRLQRDPGAARWGQPMASRWAPDVAQAAREALNGDIRLVIGPDTVASAFALAIPERPYVLLDGRADISPWVPPGLMDRCGVLFVAYEPPGPDARPIEGAPAGITWRAAPALDGLGCSGDLKKPRR